MSFFESLTHRFKALSYERQKEIAQKGSEAERLTLAKSTKTNREILFYLAEHDPMAEVRQRVALNRSTPAQANELLARDDHEDVRLALSGRLVKLLPSLPVDKQSQLYAFTVQALGTLALDEVLKVRRALSASLKDHAYAPPDVAAQLAHDIEREVSEPILRFCVALSDDVLSNIIASHPADWAAEAIAQRSKVSGFLAKKLIQKENVKAGQYLIQNKGADINEDVLHEIVSRAAEFPEWHEPLATHHVLPKKMANQLARYTDARIRKMLQKKGGYEIDEADTVLDATRRRVELQDAIETRTLKDLKQQIVNLDKKGELDEQLISDHFALGDIGFLYEFLAYRLNTNEEKIRQAFGLKKADVICAICWKSGLSARFAFRLQQELAKVKRSEWLVPKGGDEYPLTEEKMNWHLKFLEIDG